MVPANESNTLTDAMSSFVGAIRKSSILSDRHTEKLESIIANGECPTEPAELSSRLVKEGVLTEYQARQILKGKPQGLIFGGYIILDFLGKGTMGKVYKASHRMMGRLVALKILDPRHVSVSARSLARFQREMQLVGRLDHPNVVRAYDADRVSDCYFIAMEYAEGLTLEDLLKARGSIPPADVVYYAAQAAEGLAHAHARGVLHRDIKPSNLLLTAAKKLKVLDFGLGTLLEQDEQSAALTTAGIAVGTPDFISPEQARVVKLDGRSDLYSLGCTMYYLLSGQLPFKGESSMDCILMRITGQAVPISEVRPGLPPRMIEAIEKLMATNPDDRYQSADEAAAALRSMLRPKTAAPGRATPSEAAVSPAPEPVRKELTPATTAAVAAVPPGPVRKGATPSTATEIVPVPVPVPIGDSPLETRLPPVRAEVTLSKPKENSLRSRGNSRRVKASRVIAAIAVAAVSLTVVTFMLWNSSNDHGPAPQPEPSVTNNSAEVAPPAADAHEPTPAAEIPKQAAKVVTKSVGPTVRRPSLVIESPKQGATVGMKEELTGRIEAAGWPVIFVQADLPGQPWWCQAPVTAVENGKFTTKVVFGDDVTASGTRFRIVGLVTPTREDALKFNMGMKEQALPEGFPRSVETVVTHR